MGLLPVGAGTHRHALGTALIPVTRGTEGVPLPAAECQRHGMDGRVIAMTARNFAAKIDAASAHYKTHEFGDL